MIRALFTSKLTPLYETAYSQINQIEDGLRGEISISNLSIQMGKLGNNIQLGSNELNVK